MNIYILTKAQRDLIVTETLQPILLKWSSNENEIIFAIPETLIDINTLSYDSVLNEEQFFVYIENNKIIV